VHFHRLFDLAENKTITVANLFSLGMMHGREGWSWRSRLWVWEEELLEECRALLLDVSLFPNVSDKWVWLPEVVVKPFSLFGHWLNIVAYLSFDTDFHCISVVVSVIAIFGCQIIN